MLDKIVLQFGDRTVKGFTDRDRWKVETDGSLRSLPIQVEGETGFDEISLDRAKAVFFVKTFEGKSHEDLRFHDHLPNAECLWVRVVFKDNEVAEGLIHNTSTFLLEPGFFLAPIDPDANNTLIYVLKDQLQDFHVLGLRPAPRSLPHLKPSRPLTQPMD